MTLTETEPGKTARVEFRDYLYAGDVLAIEMDLATNHMRGLSVSTYIDDVDPGSSLTIAHEPIAALGWPAMTMAFKVASRDVISDDRT